MFLLLELQGLSGQLATRCEVFEHEFFFGVGNAGTGLHLVEVLSPHRGGMLRRQLKHVAASAFVHVQRSSFVESVECCSFCNIRRSGGVQSGATSADEAGKENYVKKSIAHMRRSHGFPIAREHGARDGCSCCQVEL